MKATFVVSATLKAGKDRVQAPEPVTPMLMLAKFSGMNLAADLKGLVASSEERVSEELSTSGFTGELGEHLTITLGEKSNFTAGPLRQVLIMPSLQHSPWWVMFYLTLMSS